MTKLTDAELNRLIVRHVTHSKTVDTMHHPEAYIDGVLENHDFCNDWNDAMMAVKELEKDLIFFELKSYEYKNYVMYAADFYINNGLDRASVSRVIRKNPLEAIILAALKAKGVDLNE